MVTRRFQAIFRPQMAEQVFMELAQGSLVSALVAEEVQGSGTRTIGMSSEVELLPKVSISGVVENDADLDRVVQCLRSHASTGRSGDGKVFVFPVIGEI